MIVVIFALTILGVCLSASLLWWRHENKRITLRRVVARAATFWFGSLMVAYLALLLWTASKYRGRCPSWWGEGDPCPFHQYFGREAGLITFFALPIYWPYLLLFLCVSFVVAFVITEIADRRANEIIKLK